MTYESSGIDYGPLDTFKRTCQRHAAQTESLYSRDPKPEYIRGESAYLLETTDRFLAHVEEGLGSKSLVADTMWEQFKRNYYCNIGIDTVATIVNDLVTSGALPVSLAMHAAVGDAKWFEDVTRSEELAKGFAEGCRLSDAVWGGGETSALVGIVHENAIVLAGSAIGEIKPKENRISGDIEDGDAIVLLASSGVHTNGLTLCRSIADRLRDGYATDIGSGRMLGDALLDHSLIYVPFVAACQRNGLTLRYAAHITGHGWRKLMRLQKPFVYRMSELGSIPEVFRFFLNSGYIDEREAYATFNMGAGFAVYVRASDVNRTIEIAAQKGFVAWEGGKVFKEGLRKAVEIEPLNITFEAETLNLR